MEIVIKSFKQLDKYLFFYRSFLCKRVFFSSSLKNKEMNGLIKALNEKNRYNRINYVLEEGCNYIDRYYKNCNTCKFVDNKCLCHRIKNLNIQNGCCHKCRFQSSNGCKTKNIACKLFLCSYAKEGISSLSLRDIRILKLLTPIERYIVSNNYFSSIEEVSKDIYYGFIISVFRTEFRLFKMYLFNKKKYD